MNKLMEVTNMFNSNCASVPLVANIDGNGNNGGWADGGWLWIIVVFALLFGWGKILEANNPQPLSIKLCLLGTDISNN
jgi:hypothetical protein